MLRMVSRRVATWGLLLALVVAFAGESVAKDKAKPKEPEVLFELKTPKRIQRINILGDDGNLIFLHNKASLFVYDGNTGKKIWEDKIPKYTDDGLDLIWNEKYFITSMKKGMRCYDLATGKVVWETPTDIKMKTYQEYYNFNNVFVLRFDKYLMAFDPNTGEIKWQTEGKFNPSPALSEAGQYNIWSFDRSYGGRLLILEDKEATMYDAATGEMLGVVATKFTKKNAEPVATIGDDAIALFFNDGTASMSLKDGSVLWQIDDEVDPKRGYITFDDSQGTTYAAFGFKKSFAVLNLKTGLKLWETGDDFKVRPMNIDLLDDSTLYAVGIRKSLGAIAPHKQGGTVISAAAFDLQTGTMKYEPVHLVYSPSASLDVFGIVNENAGFLGPWQVDNDLLYYVFATNAKKFEDPKLKEDGNEGLIRINPMTGEVKWRTDFVLFDTWNKELTRAGKGSNNVNMFMDMGLAPDPVLKGDYAYVSTGTGVAKVDIRTGDLVWQSPDYSLVLNVNVENGYVFGPIGYAAWSYSSDTKKQKAQDVINQTKRGGFFVLNDDTGAEVFSVEAKKSPLTLQLYYFNPETNMVYLSDGNDMQALNLATGEYAWEMDLKKKLTGPITAEDGVVFILTAVSSSTSWGYDSYTITTTKNYDVSMAHGIFPMDDRSFVVLAGDGLARVNPDGQVRWKSEWDWKRDKIQFRPTFTPKGLLYQYKKALKLISLENGQVLWQSKEKKAKDVEIQLDSRQSKVFVVGDKDISCYRI